MVFINVVNIASMKQEQNAMKKKAFREQEKRSWKVKT